MATPSSAPSPRYEFISPPSLSRFTHPLSALLSSPALTIRNTDAIATGALIFHPHTHKLLILQRASTDSMPNKWEIPGGGVDASDPSILHGLVREVWEETGLRARSVERLVGGEEGSMFLTRRGLRVVKFEFEVVVEDGEEGEGGLQVMLDEREHQKFLWVGEEDVRAKMVGGVGIEFTTGRQEEVILEGFRLRRVGGEA